ncbi:MAG: hypothetical protein ACE367_07460 [Acidimicrobiales bacterium]
MSSALSSKPARLVEGSGSADVLVPMLVANLLGVAASSARVPAFGRRPHQVAYAVCVATSARRVLDDRARHAGAVAQLALLAALSRTRGGSRSHRGIAVAATVAAIATTRTQASCSGRSGDQASVNCS